ncbi:MAG: S1/P1 nuclease [Bacteroidota bacterium]|nr:S1/P1 nuclease [Bacteroidota bacterium]
MRIIKFFIAALLFFYLPISSFAWSQEGHRIVGEIADSYLTPKARLAIKAILGNESIAMSSNWADFIKSEPSYKYLDAWHYINLEDGLSEKSFKEKLSVDTATDAYTKLNFLVKELKKKNLPKDKKIMYLRLLIHIVGDVHQPMHVSREEDLGGNKIYVLWFNQKTNLHSMWDDKLIEYQQLSYTEYVKAINFTTATQRQVWQKQQISTWLFESYQIAQQLYAEIKQPDQRLSYRYNYDHVQTLNDRLLKGGVRLAGLLNEIFG